MERTEIGSYNKSDRESVESPLRKGSKGKHIIVPVGGQLSDLCSTVTII